MAVVPVTAAAENDDPATPVDSPMRRILRRPSERYRRERPRQLRYRLAVGIAEVVSRIVAWLPDRVRDGIADRAGDIWIRSTPVYRENVIANLAQVLGPETPRPELEAKARQIFRMSARNFGELLRLKHLTPEQLTALVPISVKDLAVLHDAHERGQGIIIATAHMGAFDLLGHAIAAQGVPMTVITGRTTSRFVFDGVTHLRHSHLVTMVEPTPGGVRRVIRALRRGRDRRVRRRLRFFPERGADDLLWSRDDPAAGRRSASRGTPGRWSCRCFPGAGHAGTSSASASHSRCRRRPTSTPTSRPAWRC